jgi:hypothetical protein
MYFVSDILTIRHNVGEKITPITIFIGGINHSQMGGLLLFFPTLVVIFHAFSRPKLAATWPIPGHLAEL